MKILKPFLPLLALLCIPVAHAVTLLSDGSDGVFHPLSSITLDLPQDGVFNFTTIDIPAGVTVKFRRNAQNTPVHLLGTGDVRIAGTVDVSAGGVNLGDLADPKLEYIRPATTSTGGPGGGTGGQAGHGDTTCADDACRDAGPGTGPSPGLPGPTPTHTGLKVFGVAGGGGGMATAGDGAIRYTEGVAGSPAVPFPAPFTGGSGGGGGSGWYFFGVQLDGGAGGGGGGALHVATPGALIVDGSLLSLGANGGWSFANSGGQGGPGGGGSGGNIQLIADTVTFGSTALVDVSGGYGGGLGTQTYPFDPRAFENGARGGMGYLYVAGTQVSLAGTLNATVIAVPEPEIYASLMMGLLLIGVARTRHCAQSVLATKRVSRS